MSETKERELLLHSKGLRVTAYRLLLLEYFFSHTRPVSVGEIMHFFESKNMYPNKTTIYRELECFKNNALLSELDLGDDRKRYELSHLDHHHHLICKRCNHIQDFSFDENIELLEKNILKNNHFLITDHSFEFYGLCATCRKI